VGALASVVCSTNMTEDGVCGSANNTEQAVVPSSNLCLKGVSSVVTGDGVPYSWTCSGINGGNDVSCEATKTGWVNTGLGFYVMKYEARIKGSSNGNQTYSTSFVPESRASGTPWVNITHPQAIDECQSLGAGYHLITTAEWVAIARNLASNPLNWSTGVVGSGVLSRGYSASTTYASDGFTNTGVAPYTGLGYEYNVGANTVGPTGVFDLKRIHIFLNGNAVWDFSGNVSEWNSEICNQGAGVGNWYNTLWVEWDDSNLADYERPMAGPNPLYTSIHNAGRYYGCTANGNGLRRSGDWSSGTYAGIFDIGINRPTSFSSSYYGFRCVK